MFAEVGLKAQKMGIVSSSNYAFKNNFIDYFACF